MSIPTKRKRAVITLDVKKKIIDASARNNSKELSKQFNLPASSIRNIVGNKAAILKATDEGVEAKRQCLQPVRNKGLEEAVLQWFKGREAKTFQYLVLFWRQERRVN
uniref:HTH psq-type domain-containing protein n=1 Tax=Ditylenchus dipsaci TaxID=166011 RepID=A0A915D9V2_9BILA